MGSLSLSLSVSMYIYIPRMCFPTSARARLGPFIRIIAVAVRVCAVYIYTCEAKSVQPMKYSSGIICGAVESRAFEKYAGFMALEWMKASYNGPGLFAWAMRRSFIDIDCLIWWRSVFILRKSVCDMAWLSPRTLLSTVYIPKSRKEFKLVASCLQKAYYIIWRRKKRAMGRKERESINRGYCTAVADRFFAKEGCSRLGSMSGWRRVMRRRRRRPWG